MIQCVSQHMHILPKPSLWVVICGELLKFQISARLGQRKLVGIYHKERNKHTLHFLNFLKCFTDLSTSNWKTREILWDKTQKNLFTHKSDNCIWNINIWIPPMIFFISFFFLLQKNFKKNKIILLENKNILLQNNYFILK